MKRILITGANSYIGMSVERWLLQNSTEYRIDTLDLHKSKWKEYNFSSYDVIYHVAGIAHTDIGNVKKRQKELYYKINTKLAVEVAEKAKAEGVKQFIFMSSIIVYGKKEQITPCTQPEPVNFYGDSKWQADKKIHKLESNTFHVVVLRSPMIYGKGSRGNYPILATLAKKLPVFPKINNKRSMIYIDNLCEFVKIMIDNEESGVFFPQNREFVNTSELVKMIAEINGHKIWITRLLTPFAIIGKYMPWKIGDLCKKAFGNSYYETVMSEYPQMYQLTALQESIKKTENSKEWNEK